jgi:uncharacterized protein YukE
MADVEAIAARIKKLIGNINTKWIEIDPQILARLEAIWQGADAEAYINKVKSYDQKIAATCRALELLQNTYLKSLSEFKQRSSAIKQSVDSI